MRVRARASGYGGLRASDPRRAWMCTKYAVPRPAFMAARSWAFSAACGSGAAAAPVAPASAHEVSSRPFFAAASAATPGQGSGKGSGLGKGKGKAKG